MFWAELFYCGMCSGGIVSLLGAFSYYVSSYGQMAVALRWSRRGF